MSGLAGKTKAYRTFLWLALLLLFLLAGCDVELEAPDYSTEAEAAEETTTATGAELTPSVVLRPEAPGLCAVNSAEAEIDWSNASDGYVMLRYTAETGALLRARIVGPGTTCTFSVTPGEWSVLPLTEGSGTYEAILYIQADGSRYATVLNAVFDAEIKDEFAPFLRPNDYVDYVDAPRTVELAAELAAGREETLDIVSAVYRYVVENIAYDEELAATVDAGYTPELDSVLEKGSGICFDYAALCSAMLRCRSIPCKLVTGYAGEAFHAWISVWTEESGWVDQLYFSDGDSWCRLDPTFDSSANRSDSIVEYIGDGSNYEEIYVY